MCLTAAHVDQFSPCRMIHERGFNITGDLPAQRDIYGGFPTAVWTAGSYGYIGNDETNVKSVFIHAGIILKDNFRVIFKDHEQEISISREACKVRYRDRVLTYTFQYPFQAVFVQLAIMVLPGYLVIASPSYGVTTFAADDVDYVSSSRYDQLPNAAEGGPLLMGLETLIALAYFNGASVEFARVLTSLSLRY